MEELNGVGERIAYWRHRRMMTQVALAGQVGRSESWLAKIERGERTIEAIKDLLLLARILRVEPGDLIGGVELAPNGGPLDPPKGIIAVRRALVGPAEKEPPSAADLQADVERVGLLVAKGSYEARALVLPDALVAGRVAAEHEVPGAWSYLARLYLMTSGLVRRVGEPDLALLAADRGISAAQRSGDPLMVAHARRRLAFAFLRCGWLDEAGAVCSDASDALAPTDATSLEGWSLWGSLRLTEAVAASRADEAGNARRSLRDARTAAERVGPGRNDYWESFGPANVIAHEIAVELEGGQPVEALRLADGLDVEELPTAQRRAEVLIDVAQAHNLRRDDGAAVAVLLEAERHAPEMVYYSVLAHEIVRALLKRERKARTPGLRPLAGRMGIKV